MKPSRFNRFCVLTTCAAAAYGNAASLTWDSDATFANGSTDGSGTWDTSIANWNNGAADVAWPNLVADTAVFGAGGTPGTVTVSGTVNVGALTFNAGTTGNYTISGGTLNGVGTITNNMASGTTTVSSNITRAGGLTVNGPTSSSTTLSGQLNVTGLVIGATGSKTVTLSGAGANITGNVTIDSAQVSNVSTLILGKTAGTVAVSGDITLGHYGGSGRLQLAASDQIADTSTVNLNAGGSYGNNAYFSLMGFNETIGWLGGSHGAGGSDIVQNGAAGASVLTLAGDVLSKSVSGITVQNGSTGTLSLVKNGTGTQIFSGDNLNHTGTTTINAGTFSLVSSNMNSSATTLAGGTLNLTTATFNAALGGSSGQVTVTGGTNSNFGGGNKTYSVDTNISGASTILTQTAANSLSANSIHNIGTGAILRTGNLAGSVKALTGAGSVDLNGSSANLTIADGAGQDFAGVIGGTGGLTKAGAGTQTLSNANTFSGNTLVSAGSLALGHNLALQNSALSTSGSGTVNVTGFTTPTLGGLTGGTNLASVITVGYGSVTSLTLNPTTGTQTYSGSITNGATGMALTKTGVGTQILSGANTYTGTTTITDGTLQFTKTASLYNGVTGNWTAANLTVASGATATFNVGGTGEFAAADLDIIKGLGTATHGFQSGSFLGLDASNSTTTGFTYGSIIANPNGGSNALGLIKTGTKQLILTQANTYTGTTIVNHTTANAAGAHALILNSSSGPAITGNLQIGNSGTGTAVVHLGASGQIADTSTITFAGASGQWSYFKLMGFSETVAGLSSAANGVIENMESETVNTNVTLTVNNSADYSYTGFIRNKSSGSGTGTLAFTKEGVGTQALSGANITYTGATTVTGGTLKLTDTTAFNSAITNSATVEFNSTISNARTGAALAGDGIFNKTGTGVFQTNGGQTITATGQFNIQQGTLQNNNNAVNWSGNKADIDVSSGAILDLFADAIYADALTGAGFVQNNYGNTTGESGSSDYLEKLVIGTNNGTGTFDGVIRNNATNAALGSGVGKGGIQLEKTGTGTQSLTGTNTYTGTTSVNQGRLNINGSINSHTSVGTTGAAAILGGDGTITGNLNVGADGSLLPGQGGTTDRTLNITGNVSAVAGANVTFNLTSEASMDQLIVGGSMDLTNFTLVVNMVDTSFTELGLGMGDEFLTNPDTFDLANGSFYKLIAGTTTGMFSNVTDVMSASELAYYELTGTQYKTSIDGQEFWVAQGSTYLVAIPEPRAALLGGLVMLLLRRRRN